MVHGKNQMESEHSLKIVQNAEAFAKKKHAGQMLKNSTTSYSKHLEEVVDRLKSLGVIDSELLCAGWLHDSIENTETNFDEVYDKFDNVIAVLVSSLTRDKFLPTKIREQQYVKQLKGASPNAKLIKFCDIAANLSNLKNSKESNSRKIRQIRQMMHYLMMIKNELPVSQYPRILIMLESINKSLKTYGLKTISI